MNKPTKPSPNSTRQAVLSNDRALAPATTGTVMPKVKPPATVPVTTSKKSGGNSGG